MQLTRNALDEAIARGLIDRAQADALWAFLEQRQPATPRFRPAHILYYLGGMIAIGAMTLFMTLGWERFSGAGLLAIATAYALGALALTEWLRRRPALALPAGITATLAVVMVPLAVYGAQHALGWWPPDGPDGGRYRDFHTRIDWRWLLMEGATLAAGAVALWRYRLPFLVMPVAVTLWYVGMDLTPFLFGGDPRSFFSDEGRRVTTAFGAAMLLLALWVDLRSRHTADFAFWLYLFGVLTFWGGLTSLEADSERARFAYAMVNLAMIAVGAALSRRVFAVFGGIGIAFYLGYLSHTVFKDSLWFPVALTAIGGAIITAGIAWQRHEAAIGRRLRAWLPAAVRDGIERRESADRA